MTRSGDTGWIIPLVSFSDHLPRSFSVPLYLGTADKDISQDLPRLAVRDPFKEFLNPLRGFFVEIFPLPTFFHGQRRRGGNLAEMESDVLNKRFPQKSIDFFEKCGF